MGYDRHEKSSSSGAVVAVLLAITLIVVLGGLFLVGVGVLFWVRTANVASRQAVVAEMEAQQARALAEAKAAEAEAQRQQAELSRIQAGAEGGSEAAGEAEDFHLRIERDGSLILGGEPVDLDGLKRHLANLPQESPNPLRIQIDVAPESLHEHLVRVLEACDRTVDDVTFRISLRDETDEP